MESKYVKEQMMTNGELDTDTGKITGSGYIVDEPGAKIRYDVQAADADNKVQFVLRAANNITWWKALHVFVWVNGNWVGSKRIETKNSNRESSIDFLESEMTREFQLQFWKAGKFGIGALATTLIIDSYAKKFQRITFTWERD